MTSDEISFYTSVIAKCFYGYSGRDAKLSCSLSDSLVMLRKVDIVNPGQGYSIGQFIWIYPPSERISTMTQGRVLVSEVDEDGGIVAFDSFMDAGFFVLLENLVDYKLTNVTTETWNPVEAGFGLVLDLTFNYSLENITLVSGGVDYLSSIKLKFLPEDSLNRIPYYDTTVNFETGTIEHIGIDSTGGFQTLPTIEISQDPITSINDLGNVMIDLEWNFYSKRMKECFDNLLQTYVISSEIADLINTFAENDYQI